MASSLLDTLGAVVTCNYIVFVTKKNHNTSVKTPKAFVVSALFGLVWPEAFVDSCK